MLTAVATINLWGENFWQERKTLLIDTLSQSHLTASSPIILTFQEVDRGAIYPLLDVAFSLGFSEREVYFFPTIISGLSGLGVITNLKVIENQFVFFTHDKTDPLEFGERGIALLSLKDDKGIIILGTTHLSVSEQIQYIHAFESIHAMLEFSWPIIFPKKRGHSLRGESFSSMCDKARFLLTGDFNASPDLPLYQLFHQAGLTDYTHELQKRFGFSWPTNVQWLIDMHKKTFGKNPPFDVKNLQRWIDYIWGCGFTPKKETLLGRKPLDGMYPSDHLIPVVYFQNP